MLGFNGLGLCVLHVLLLALSGPLCGCYCSLKHSAVTAAVLRCLAQLATTPQSEYWHTLPFEGRGSQSVRVCIGSGALAPNPGV